MRVLILLAMTFSLIFFQNCSDATFSNASGSPSGKAGAEILDVGPGLDEVAEEDREAVHDYFRCEHDEDSSDDDDSSDDLNTKVYVCHNDHVICISKNALDAHLSVHADQQGDTLVDQDNYGACDDDDDSESDDEVVDVDLVE